jgi:DNA-directed RNA polymerase specialized sigma24 family protein
MTPTAAHPHPDAREDDDLPTQPIDQDQPAVEELPQELDEELPRDEVEDDDRDRARRHGSRDDRDPGRDVRRDHRDRGGSTLADQLERRGPTPGELRWWAVREPALAGLASFDALRAELHDERVPPERKDARLAALLRLVVHYGDGPAEAVLALMVPGMRGHVRRFAPGLDPDEAWAAITSDLCERIGRYAPNPPTEKVASNLLWPATNAMITVLNTERAWAKRTGPLGQHATREPAPGGADDLTAETLLGDAVAAGVLSPLDAALIDATYLHGLPVKDAALLLGVGYEAAKKRRQRARARWVAWWAPELRRASGEPAP